jgi:hypothetical protein
MSSWNAYDNNISDHRPVGLKLKVDAVISTIHNLENSDKNIIKIVDILGRETKPKKNTPLFYMYENGSVVKKIMTE